MSKSSLSVKLTSHSSSIFSSPLEKIGNIDIGVCRFANCVRFGKIAKVRQVLKICVKNEDITFINI